MTTKVDPTNLLVREKMLTSEMLKIDGAAYGEVKTVRAADLERETRDGWKLFAVVPDTAHINVHVEQPDRDGRVRSTFRTEERPVTLFVIGRNEGDAMAALYGQLREVQAELTQARQDLHQLRQSHDAAEAAAKKAAADHERALETLQRDLKQTEADRRWLQQKTEHDAAERETLFGTLKSVLGDPDVNDAVIAAITVSAAPVAKQMITDLMQLRETVGVKTKEAVQ